jgi:hypothetical protein
VRFCSCVVVLFFEFGDRGKYYWWTKQDPPTLCLKQTGSTGLSLFGRFSFPAAFATPYKRSAFL